MRKDVCDTSACRLTMPTTSEPTTSADSSRNGVARRRCLAAGRTARSGAFRLRGAGRGALFGGAADGNAGAGVPGRGRWPARRSCRLGRPLRSAELGASRPGVGSRFARGGPDRLARQDREPGRARVARRRADVA